MDNDDRQIGRILTRREVLALLGTAGAALLAGGAAGRLGIARAQTVLAPQSYLPVILGGAGTAAPSCVVRPEVTEGPYFVDEGLNRSDIRSDPATGVVRQGAPLALTFNVAQISEGGCAALPGAMVDIWHCDAAGLYSDVSDAGFNTVGQKFLRGYQLTDSDGRASFTTIYPGWYSGRAVHIHFKIRTAGASGPSYEFTSQLFFDDALSDQVFAQAPYASKGRRNTLNSNDSIYRPQLLLAVAQAGQGYAASFDLGLSVA